MSNSKSTRSAKSMVMKPQYRMRVVADKRKYSRKRNQFETRKALKQEGFCFSGVTISNLFLWDFISNNTLASSYRCHRPRVQNSWGTRAFNSQVSQPVNFQQGF